GAVAQVEKAFAPVAGYFGGGRVVGRIRVGGPDEERQAPVAWPLGIALERLAAGVVGVVPGERLGRRAGRTVVGDFRPDQRGGGAAALFGEVGVPARGGVRHGRRRQVEGGRRGGAARVLIVVPRLARNSQRGRGNVGAADARVRAGGLQGRERRERGV